MKAANDWRPGASLDLLRRRARLLARVRAFFADRLVMEVETPVLAAAGVTDPHLENLQTVFAMAGETPGRPLYLQTSPEYAMKRLLAAGSGDIYQLCKVFRAGEQGTRHNPEFTLLEWYRLGFDMQTMMQEVTALLSELLADRLIAMPITLTYRQAFIDYAQIDPFATSSAQWQQAFLQHTQQEVAGASESDWLDLLLSFVVQPRLPTDRLVFITHFPALQASLAKLDASDATLARRFEVFAGGLELANGFEELTDYTEQAQRIATEQTTRRTQGRDCLPVDARFLAALQHGLPACSGVAVGVDRIVMLATGQAQIADVISFDFTRA